MKQAYDLASEVQRRSGCPSPAAKPTAPRRGCLIARTPLLATNRCSLERLHRGVDSGQVRRPPCAHSALHTVDRRARQSAVAPILLQRRQRVRAVAARQQHRALCRQRREPLARGSVKGDGAGGGRTNKTLRPADGNHTGGDLSRISHVDDPNVFFVREEAEGLQRGENALAAATATATAAVSAAAFSAAAAVAAKAAADLLVRRVRRRRPRRRWRGASAQRVRCGNCDGGGRSWLLLCCVCKRPVPSVAFGGGLEVCGGGGGERVREELARDRGRESEGVEACSHGV
mmetsp:Transcript_12146/g.38670  ORF Transcript_12146/g.38670 Transcript_12146/m.38670 type:complete len:288 (+) Transcript_12146:27-890(+)